MVELCQGGDTRHLDAVSFRLPRTLKHVKSNGLRRNNM